MHIAEQLLQADGDIGCLDTGSFDGNADGHLCRGHRCVRVACGTKRGAILLCSHLVQYGDVGALRNMELEEGQGIINGVRLIVELVDVCLMCAEVSEIVLDVLVSLTTVATVLQRKQ